MAQAQGNFLDNDWHHVAIAVNRNSGRAQFYVDGVLNMYFDAAGLGGIAVASVYLGARGWYMKDNADHVTFDRFFTGVIVGFRLWNTYLDATLINNTSNILLQGDEHVPMLYYKFEELWGADVANTLKDKLIFM